MGSKKTNIVKNAIFLGIGIAMMAYVFKDTNWDDLWKDVKSMDYSYYLISGVFVILSHYFRALRWKQLIVSIGHNPSTKNAFASVLFMYVSNLIIPRSGEVARCGSIYKYEKIPVPALFGTVVIERLIDVLSLLALTGLLVIIQFEVISKIYYDSSMDDMVQSLLANKILLSIVVVAGILIAFFLYKIRKKIFALGPLKKVEGLLIELKNSFLKLLKLDNKFLFFVYTIAIWVCYVCMFYIPFYAFEPTSHLGFVAGLTAFVAGSYGMVAPIQGGVGVWQFMVIMALVAMGIPEDAATSWAGVSFILLTLITATAGVIGFISLPYINKDKSLEQ